jgi:hypothetical protein
MPYTLVDQHGEAAAAPLGALLEEMRGEPLPILSAPALIETAEAAKILAGRLADQKELKITRPYFERVDAAIARDALGPVAGANANARAILAKKGGVKIAIDLSERIAWTDDVRRKVDPCRARPNPVVSRADQASGFYDDEWKRGEKKATGEMKRLMLAVRDQHATERSVAALKKLEVDVEAAATSIAPGHWRSAIVDLWVGREGLPFALEVMARAHRFGAEYTFERAEVRWLIARPPEGEDGGLEYEAERLREHVAAADDAAYAAGRRAAEKLREGATLGLRAAIAFTFPDEPWGEDDAREALARPGELPRIVYKLAGAVSTLAIAAQLVDRAAAGSSWDSGSINAFTLVDRFGHDAAPLVARLYDEASDYHRNEVLDALLLLEGKAAARALLGVLEDRKKKGERRKRALDWYERLPQHALRGLLPVVAEGGARAAAARAITQPIVKKQPELVAAVEKQLDRKEIAKLAAPASTVKLPGALAKAPKEKLPKWLDAAGLPSVKTKAGKALGGDGTEAVCRFLAAGEAPPGLEPASVTALARAVFQSWLLAGAPAKDGWALDALGEVGDAETAAELVELAVRWTDEGGHARAGRALAAAASIDDDESLREIGELAERAKIRVLREHARDAFGLAARQRKLSPDALAEELAPEIPAGTRVDAQLRVIGGGTRELKAMVAREAKRTARRLEAMMCERRTFTAAEFKDRVLGNVLTVQLARRLVWQTGKTLFRVDDADALVGAGGEKIKLGKEIALPHPAVTKLDSAVWTSLASLQPFEQIARGVYALAAKETKSILRWKGVAVPTGRVLGLERGRGWRRGPVEDNGLSWSIAKGGATLELAEGGIVAGDPASIPTQTLGAVSLLGKLDALDASELIRDLESLRADV